MSRSLLNLGTLIQQVDSSSDPKMRAVAEALKWIESAHNTAESDVKAVAVRAEEIETGIKEVIDPRVGNVTIVNAVATLTDPTDFGLRFYMVAVTYNGPVPKNAFSKVRIYVDDGSGKVTEQGVSYCPGTFNTAYFTWEPPAEQTTLTVYLASSTDNYDVPLVTTAGLSQTPNVPVTLLPVVAGGAGAEWSANVTGFALTGSPTVTYFYDAAGVYRARIKPTWTNPTDTRFTGIDLILLDGVVYKNLGRYVTPATVELDCPPSVRTVRLYARGVAGNKVNTLTGTVPYLDFSYGDANGKLDLGKALTSSVGSALQVVAGVLGVPTNGITEDLIAQFAVSQAKLANAPIIDTARIVDAAITTAKIEALAVTNALIANAAITTAKIGDLQVTSAKIAALAAEKIQVGTITVGSGGMYFSGAGGLNMIDGGNIAVNPGYVQGVRLKALSGAGGWEIGVSAGIDYSGSVGPINAPNYKVAGVEVITGARGAAFTSLDIGGTTVINASRGGAFTSLTVGGTAVSLDGHNHTAAIDAAIAAHVAAYHP